MSDLSEAEKRKILRERRQKKFNNGGASSRLNKITGQVDSKLSTESPLETPRSKIIETAKNDTVIDSPDPEIPNIDDHVKKQTPTAKVDDAQVNLFKQLADMQKDGSTPDLFSLLKSMNGENGEESPFSKMETSPQDAPTPVDTELLKYHDYLVNTLKAKSILIKWLFFLLPYLYLVTRGGRTPLIPVPAMFAILLDPSYFFMIFTSFEMVATSIYYQKLQSIEKTHKINTLDNSSKIIKLVSMVPEGIIPIPNLKGKAVLALQYWDVLSLFLTDICFVLLFMGIMAYF